MWRAFTHNRRREKLLKAYLTHHEMDFPFTHNLARLIRLCAQVDPTFMSLSSVVEPLTPYAVELRYDVEFRPSDEDAAEALSLARNVREFVLARLPEDGAEEREGRRKNSPSK